MNRHQSNSFNPNSQDETAAELDVLLPAVLELAFRGEL
jgi:hypothetical protein